MNDSIAKSMARHRINTAIEHLLGMAQGMLADGHLHDMEIQFLSTWISSNKEATQEWPVSAIAAKVRDILVDGVITQEERDHLTQTLHDLLANDFSETGSVGAEPTRLPVCDDVEVEFDAVGFCLTGEFAYGTRASCERLLERAGAVAMDSVSKKIRYLVIGTRVSADWAHTSYGRKIERAVELQQQGHRVHIITEKRWLQALGH